MAKSDNDIISLLADNSFVIFADASGARILSRLRGATADEIGLMLGAAQASLDRQISSIREHVRGKAGQNGVDWFEGGLIVGRTKDDYEEGLMIREVPKPKE